MWRGNKSAARWRKEYAEAAQPLTSWFKSRLGLQFRYFSGIALLTISVSNSRAIFPIFSRKLSKRRALWVIGR